MCYSHKKTHFKALIRKHLYTHRPQLETSNCRQSALPEEG
jgi:hypothetical protein